MFFRSPGGLEATKGPHSAARAYPTQRRHAAHATRQDRRRFHRKREQWQTVGVGVRTQHHYRPTTDHTKKHAPTSKASTRARATTPPTAPGAAPKQRDKTPTRPRRQPDDTSASKRQPFARINDDTQPNQRRPTSKGSRMRALARVREPYHATATKCTTKVQRRHERERATISQP